jgi:uncharacterized phage protein (TIGR02220 family)
MPSRGVFRGVSSVLFDDPDYQRLSTAARCLLVTLRLCRDAGPAAIFEYATDKLMRQTGLGPRPLETAFQALEADRWIEREYPIVWIRNGLRYDPLVRLPDPRHKAAVLRSIYLLPRLRIVARFCEYYEIVGPTPLGPPGPTPSVIGDSSLRDKGEGSREKGLEVLQRSTSLSSSVELDRANLRNQAKEILRFLNQQAHKSFRESDLNLKLIEARLKSGMTLANLRGIVARKVRAWSHDPKMAQFLRPATLFSATNAEQYLGERDPDA